MLQILKRQDKENTIFKILIKEPEADVVLKQNVVFQIIGRVQARIQRFGLQTHCERDLQVEMIAFAILYNVAGIVKLFRLTIIERGLQQLRLFVLKCIFCIMLVDNLLSLLST